MLPARRPVSSCSTLGQDVVSGGLEGSQGVGLGGGSHWRKASPFGADGAGNVRVSTANLRLELRQEEEQQQLRGWAWRCPSSSEGAGRRERAAGAGGGACRAADRPEGGKAQQEDVRQRKPEVAASCKLQASADKAKSRPASALSLPSDATAAFTRNDLQLITADATPHAASTSGGTASPSAGDRCHKRPQHRQQHQCHWLGQLGNPCSRQLAACFGF
eukprot:XP_001696888.1 predicted protein [Chlamydomonas reinhardtii]